MIYIKKGTEPRSLTEYRSQPGATYDGYREKDDVRGALLEEQGYICAYCMRRISKEQMKIEHWKAQNASDGAGAEYALSYRNMLGVCLGNQSSPHEMQTCDTHRGNADLFVDPRDAAHISQILYRGDGTIYSKNLQINFDLNERLNLNCESALLKQGAERSDSKPSILSKTPMRQRTMDSRTASKSQTAFYDEARRKELRLSRSDSFLY